MKKRILCVVLLALTLAGVLCAPAGAELIVDRALDQDWILEDFSGSADADSREAFFLAPYYRMMYSLDTETGELNIYCGTDEAGNVVYERMLPYAKDNWVPWKKNRDLIKTAYIHEGVQSLGRYSFVDCDNLTELYLPHSIRRINRTSLYNCNSVETVYYAGTRKDFVERIIYEETRNWCERSSEFDLLYTLEDKIHYGESVGVICKNEEGDTFKTYTVGGYFAGDKYTIVPEVYEGLSYVGKESEITGKFKSGDTTVYELTYHCDHEYIVKDPSKPCGSTCKYCGRLNPEPPKEHTWAPAEVKSERGFLTPLDQTVVCSVCGGKQEEYKQPYALYIGVSAAGVVFLGVITAAIVIPIRKKKKMKDMTW